MKNLIIYLFFVSFVTLYAQDKKGNCNFVYQVSVENSINDEIKSIYDSKIQWNFSKLDLKNISCTIEIVPIKDCMNELNATKFKTSFVISSSDAGFSPKGSKVLNYLEFMAKCYKWRVIITDTIKSCSETSEWKYISFLSKN